MLILNRMRVVVGNWMLRYAVVTQQTRQYH